MACIDKNKNKSKKRTQLKGGAIFSFNLDDKIGGQPARISLNGTADGDCPSTDTKDLGFVNYGLTRGGGSKRHSRASKHKKMSKSKMGKSKMGKSKMGKSKMGKSKMGKKSRKTSKKMA
jgi:hypothetical protein